MDIDYRNYHRDAEYKKLEGTFRNIFKKRLNLILRFVTSGSVLDIGCSNGILLDLFKEKGFETWGVEPSENAKAARRKGHRVSNTFFEKSDLPKNYFDLVVLNHTLEHLEDPVSVLRRSSTLLKNNGILYVDVPNAGGISARILGKYWPYRAPDEHKWQFTRNMLEDVFEKAGFKPVYFESRSGFFEYENPFSEIKRKRFVLDIVFSPFSLIATLFNMGDSMSIIGKKV